jgi:hypothetical protein
MSVSSAWSTAAALVLLVPTFSTRAEAQPRPARATGDTIGAEALRNERRQDPRIAPARREGDGPFSKLIIRAVTLIDGTGAPPRGPVDIVIENNQITQVASVGYPGAPIDTAGRPKGAVREIDGAGMYVMPGIIDLHVHQGTKEKAPDSEYYNKLWLAHGITTVRGVPFASFDYSVKEKMRSAKSEITAPRYVVYQRPGSGWGQGSIRSPEQARARTDSSSAPSGPPSWRRSSTRPRSLDSARPRISRRRVSLK